MEAEQVKVGSFQKVKAKCSNLSNRHAYEPKIVPELLFPLNVINTIFSLTTCTGNKSSSTIFGSHECHFDKLENFAITF